jgi:hypothetical protein
MTSELGCHQLHLPSARIAAISKKRRATQRAILASALDARAANAIPQQGTACDRRAGLRLRLEARWAAQAAAARTVEDQAAALPDSQLTLWQDYARATDLEADAVQSMAFDINRDFFDNAAAGSAEPVRNDPGNKRYASMIFSHDIEAASDAKRRKLAHTSQHNAYPDASPH